MLKLCWLREKHHSCLHWNLQFQMPSCVSLHKYKNCILGERTQKYVVEGGFLYIRLSLNWTTNSSSYLWSSNQNIVFLFCIRALHPCGVVMVEYCPKGSPAANYGSLLSIFLCTKSFHYSQLNFFQFLKLSNSFTCSHATSPQNWAEENCTNLSAQTQIMWGSKLRK